MTGRLSAQDRADLIADRRRLLGQNPAPSEQPGGILARYDGFCWKCDRALVANESRVALRRGSWVCVDCGGAGE